MRRKKNSDREKMKISKRQKKDDEEKKQREIHLKAYTKALNRGNSGSLPSSVILSPTIDNSSTSTTTSVLVNPITTPQTTLTHNPNSPLTLSSDSGPISQDPSSPSSEELSNLTNSPSHTLSAEAICSDPYDFETIGNLVKSLVRQQRTETIPP